MRSARLLPLVLFIPLFLTACVTPQPGTGKPGSSEAEKGVDYLQAVSNANIVSYAYAMEIKRAIEEKMYNPESYHGQACRIRISLTRDGSVSNATAENGPRKLCNAALIAVKQANIPPAPDEKTWLIFKNTPLDFRL